MKNIIVVVVAVALFGCGAGGTAVKKSPYPDNQEAAKARFQSLMKRESAGLKPVKAAGNLQITVLSKGKPQATLTNAAKPVQHTLTIPIGSALDVTCYLTDEMSSPAVTLKTLFDNVLKVPTIEAASVKTIEADIFRNIGYIYLEAEYLTKDKKYGTAKIIAASMVEMSFYCTHDELGYKKTFLSVADSVATSSYVQNFVKEFSGYVRKQIDIASVNNMEVGYAESYQFDGEKNTKRNFSFTTFLIPRSQTELMAGDSVDTTVYNKETGALVSGTYYSYENNEAEHEIKFEKTGPKQYRVEGVLQGKNFDKTFDSDQPLMYSGFILDQYSAGKTPNKEWNFKEYIPQSPVKPTKSRILVKEKMPNGNRKIEYRFHTAKALIEVDDKSYANMNLEMGNLSFLITRKYFDGR
jgi:hypothetical protein